MEYRSDRPAIVQSDRTVLLETRHPLFAEARAALSRFCELVKSPEYIHTYRITPLSLWNAAASGVLPEEVLDTLDRYSKYGLPPTLVAEVRDTMRRYGLLRLQQRDGRLLLSGEDGALLGELLRYPSLQRYVQEQLSPTAYAMDGHARGLLKQELLRLGYPVRDLAGYQEGEACPLELKDVTASGLPFRLRDYQQAAVDAFYEGGTEWGGSGVLVLPCGAGKTVIGLAAMSQLKTATLILTTSTTSVRQWKRELLDKTSIDPSLVGEYTGEEKQVKPITIATYQILTHRRRTDDEFPHMRLFHERNWGLIIYDEVHLLPAPVFRVTAGIQAKRRLGLTATLVREDGCAEEVFSLIGPKKYDLPWKELERHGWIAEACCREIRLSIDPLLRQTYAQASPQQKFRIAAENPRKLEVIRKLLKRHHDARVLIIGQYLKQLKQVAGELGVPLITGSVSEQERQSLYQRFRTGELTCLVVSKVANFAVDLPEANVAIQISGTFGSRQEEAQRLGRLLRPKQNVNQAFFYTLVTRDTREQEFAMHRQLFLVEQGYRYEIVEAEAIE
ncbi:DNA repair helicase XPB [Brevibacillus marinus]|uniref:DNA repair helicase XPB n=1 Tax=Brevibacillus marinus TaxID=2496837 RepID=UPI000F822E3D|nr:DNA repair helicase XPB [Brevibacillus marinus]